MNWKLIFQLSLFGLAMGVATCYFISSKVEPFCWLPIFVLCAYIIAKKCSGKYFLNGMCVSLVNSVWITAAHIIMFNTYIAHHAAEAAQMAKMSAKSVNPISPQLIMLSTGPIIGLLSGIVLGSFAFIASRIVPQND